MRANPPRPPLTVEPSLVPRPWGARRLGSLLAAPQQQGAAAPGREERIGEAWLVGPESVVTSAPYAGETLEALCARFGAPFVGARPFDRHGARMPLLAKLLDAAEPLSLQVHPDDEGARRLAPERRDLGKTEAWLVLEAEPGSVVWWGFERPVDQRAVRDALARGTLAALLRRLEVAAGDVIALEAGTVHALGGGLLVSELQQASDLTFRLDDHGRVGPDGRPRELHVEQALAVARLEPHGDPAPPPTELAPGRVRLVRTSAFTMERWVVGGPAPAEQRFEVGEGSLEVWTVLDGEATLATDEGAVTLGRYASVAVPAGVGTASWRGSATMVRGRA